MAARTLYPTQTAGPTNWSNSTWALSDGGTENEAPPTDEDDVIFTPNSGDITLDTDGEAASLDMYISAFDYTGTLDMSTNSLIIGGDVYLAGNVIGDSGAIIQVDGFFVTFGGMTFDNTDIAMQFNSNANSILTNNVTLGYVAIGAATILLGSPLTCGNIALGSTVSLDLNTSNLICGDISGSGSMAFGSSTVTASSITLDNIIVTAGGGSINANIDVGSSGSLTFSDDTDITGNFEITGGTVTDNGHEITINEGNYEGTSGTLNSTGKWIFTNTSQTDLQNVVGLILAEIQITTDSECRLIGDFHTKIATINGDIVNSTDEILSITTATTAWWGEQTGTVSVPVQVIVASTAPCNNDITLNDKSLTFINPEGAGSATTYVVGDMSLGTGGLLIFAYPATGTANLLTLSVSGTLDAGGVLLGWPVDTYTSSGGLILSDNAHTIASLVSGSDDNGLNAIDFNASSMTVSGTLDGDNITITSDSSTLSGGTITNVDNDGNPIIEATNSVDDGGNVNVNFFTAGDLLVSQDGTAITSGQTTAVEFLSIFEDSGVSTLDFLLTNSDDEIDITVTSVIDSDDFSLVDSLPIVIPDNDSRTITIQMPSDSTGVKSGQVQIVWQLGTFTFPVSGSVKKPWTYEDASNLDEKVFSSDGSSCTYVDVDGSEKTATVTWKYINGAYVAATTVCKQELFLN